MTFKLSGLLSSFLLLLPPLALLGQIAPPTPQDPAALLSSASEKNGLNSPDVRPWHIRGEYTFFDKDGKPEDTGVYEEWWLGPTKYKRSFVGTKLKQVEYATGTELFREGSQDWPSGNAMMLRENLIEPLPDDSIVKEFKPKEHERSVAKIKFNCVTLEYPVRPNVTLSNDFFPMFCFEPTVPVLRLNSPGGGVRTGYNQVVSFQGHYLAKEYLTTVGGKPKIELKLDVVESLKNPPESLVTPPADALRVDLATISFKSNDGSRWLSLLKQAVPVYPETAKSRGISGVVVMQVTIGKDGHVSNLRVTSGQKELQQAAIDAVSQWIYKPLWIMGEPYAFDTEVKVVFNLG